MLKYMLLLECAQTFTSSQLRCRYENENFTQGFKQKSTQGESCRKVLVGNFMNKNAINFHCLVKTGLEHEIEQIAWIVRPCYVHAVSTINRTVSQHIVDTKI